LPASSSTETRRRDHTANRGANLGGAGRVGVNALDLGPDPAVEGLTDAAVIGAHSRQLVTQDAQHAFGHLRAQRPPDQPPAGRAHLVLDEATQRVMPAVERPCQLAE